VALDAIVPSPLNPRRHRNKLQDADLMASISTHGILTPLLVRPLETSGKYQIAAGHRRYEAAQKLSLAALPVQIRQMDDREYMEILHVENLQREDVHPMDEAIGYKKLLEQGYDVATLCARLGKSETHVYQQLKLNELIKEAQKLFLEDKMSFGHAIILARLEKNQQKDILAHHLFTHLDEAVPVRQLGEYVRRCLYLDLGNIPWSLDDEELLREAGSCSRCPKRTGSNPSLFTDIEKNICTDRACFEKKMQAHIANEIRLRPTLVRFSDYAANHRNDRTVLTSATCRRIWGKSAECGSAEEAIVIDGGERGKTIFVCRDKACAKHRLQSGRANGIQGLDSAMRKKHRAEKTFRHKLFSEIRNKVQSLPGDKVTRIIARAMWRRVAGDSRRALLKVSGHDVPRASVEPFGDRLLEKAKPVELGRMMVCMSIAEELMVPTTSPGKPEIMLKLADAYGVDVQSIRDRLQTEAKSSASRQRKPRKVPAA
jgi:ParB/RepB/Spo0J family partition protein